MKVDAQALRELLERAVALEADVEAKAAAGVLEGGAAAVMAEVAELRADLADLEADAGGGPAAAVGAVDAADEAVGVGELEGWDLAGGDGVEWGVDFDGLDDEPGGGVVKAAGWAPCPRCSSGDADEYADGTARCADCGAVLARVEKKAVFEGDVDADDDDEGVELVDEGGQSVEPEEKSGAVELEALIARRGELGV